MKWSDLWMLSYENTCLLIQLQFTKPDSNCICKNQLKDMSQESGFYEKYCDKKLMFISCRERTKEWC